MNDLPRVLVAYASPAGSTAEVAQRIAAVLETSGAQVTCRPTGVDLVPTDFDALVVGSAVHDMNWLAPALDLLARVPDTGGGPLWCFSVCGLRDPERNRLHRWLAARERQRIEQRFPPSARPRAGPVRTCSPEGTKGPASVPLHSAR